MANSEMQIDYIDRSNNTVYMTVNGCAVTAICSPDPDPSLYDDIEQLLISSLVHRHKKQKEKARVHSTMAR